MNNNARKSSLAQKDKSISMSAPNVELHVHKLHAYIRAIKRTLSGRAFSKGRRFPHARQWRREIRNVNTSYPYLHEDRR